MILNMNPGQTSNSEQHVKEVQIVALDDGAALKAQEWVIDPS